MKAKASFMTDTHEHCRILIAEWFANFLISLELDIDKEYVHLPSTPHNWAFSILCDLKICRRNPKVQGYKLVTKPDKIRKKIEYNISKYTYFQDYFLTFMELAVYFCGMEERVHVPFPIHDDVRELFEEFERIGFIKIIDSEKVHWTKQLNEQTRDRIDHKIKGNLDSRTLKKRPFRYSCR